MDTKIVSVGRSPEIELEHIGGDLEIMGWDRAEVEVDGDDVHEFEQDGDSVIVSCGGDLRLSVPRGASLSLTFVGGDLSLQNVDGEIEMDFVGGDASLKNLSGEVSVEGVMGDLEMDNVTHVKVEQGKRGPSPDFSAKISRKV